MRILLISDIHGNWPALAALREPYDVCLCMGDLVEYGPEPGKVIDWVRANAAHCVRGNHDHGVAQNVEISGVGGFRYLTMATRAPTIQMLSAEHRRYLAELPTIQLATVGGKRFLLVHATPRDPMDEYVMADPTQWANRVSGWNVDYVCVGHTHYQFALDVVGTKVINPGSLGLQRDGVPTARYAIIDDGKIELKTMEYDTEAAVAAVMDSPFEDKAKAMMCDVYRLGRYQHALPSMNGFHAPQPERIGA
ncbi:MAG: metallophosphoesterase family protein [Gemmataceae bacterium]|nr:metallophosphoesterase family protein [Planctomycetia bacterium]MBX3398536.1 metallophosphoesterase family protein [Gemmataceae bacterium]